MFLVDSPREKTVCPAEYVNKVQLSLSVSNVAAALGRGSKYIAAVQVVTLVACPFFGACFGADNVDAQSVERPNWKLLRNLRRACMVSDTDPRDQTFTGAP